MGRFSLGKDPAMRRLGLPIMLTLAANIHTGAQNCERRCNAQSRTLPAPEGKP